MVLQPGIGGSARIPRPTLGIPMWKDATTGLKSEGLVSSSQSQYQPRDTGENKGTEHEFLLYTVHQFQTHVVQMMQEKDREISELKDLVGQLQKDQQMMMQDVQQHMFQAVSPDGQS